jgi:hypothetical protein
VDYVKRKIFDALGVRPDQQAIFYKGQQLCDGQTLQYYKIGHMSEVRLQVRSPESSDSVRKADEQGQRELVRGDAKGESDTTIVKPSGETENVAVEDVRKQTCCCTLM